MSSSRRARGSLPFCLNFTESARSPGYCLDPYQMEWLSGTESTSRPRLCFCTFSMVRSTVRAHSGPNKFFRRSPLDAPLFYFLSARRDSDLSFLAWGGRLQDGSSDLTAQWEAEISSFLRTWCEDHSNTKTAGLRAGTHTETTGLSRSRTREASFHYRCRTGLLFSHTKVLCFCTLNALSACCTAGKF